MDRRVGSFTTEYCFSEHGCQVLLKGEGKQVVVWEQVCTQEPEKSGTDRLTMAESEENMVKISAPSA